MFTLRDTIVNWVSQLQKIVVLSSMKVEYIAATEANKEFIWLKNLMKELRKKYENHILFSDKTLFIFYETLPFMLKPSILIGGFTS